MTDVDDEVTARRRAYGAAVERLATDPAALEECQRAAREWAEVDVDEDGRPRAAPEEVLRVVRHLASQATTHVGRASGQRPASALLRWLTRSRLGRDRGWPVVPILGTPWQDTISGERPGWRQRSAYLHGEFVFGVDYLVCTRCSAGWIEQPYTVEPFRRCGLAAAALAALRSEHPGLARHTLGGHFREAHAFWEAAGGDVPGGYQQRDLCTHGVAG